MPFKIRGPLMTSEFIVPNYGVVIAVVPKGDRFLFIQESKAHCQGLWALPGGRIEPYESLLKATIREVEEEAGILVKPLGILKISQYVFLPEPNPEGCGGLVPAGSIQKMEFAVLASPTSGTLKRNRDEHSQVAAWLNQEEIAKRNLRADFYWDLIKLSHEPGKLLGFDAYTYEVTAKKHR
jgi:ADP-ribose pyrophosphatase YjhB (NUDIX family)